MSQRCLIEFKVIGREGQLVLWVSSSPRNCWHILATWDQSLSCASRSQVPTGPVYDQSSQDLISVSNSSQGTSVAVWTFSHPGGQCTTELQFWMYNFGFCICVVLNHDIGPTWWCRAEICTFELLEVVCRLWLCTYWSTGASSFTSLTFLICWVTQPSTALCCQEWRGHWENVLWTIPESPLNRWRWCAASTSKTIPLWFALLAASPFHLLSVTIPQNRWNWFSFWWTGF